MIEVGIYLGGNRRPGIPPGLYTSNTLSQKVRSVKGDFDASRHLICRISNSISSAGVPPALSQHTRDTRSSQSDRAPAIVVRYEKLCSILARRAIRALSLKFQSFAATSQALAKRRIKNMHPQVAHAACAPHQIIKKLTRIALRLKIRKSLRSLSKISRVKTPTSRTLRSSSNMVVALHVRPRKA